MLTETDSLGGGLGPLTNVALTFAIEKAQGDSRSMVELSYREDLPFHSVKRPRLRLIQIQQVFTYEAHSWRF